MVTNLTQEAKAKWAEAIAAKDPEEKLRLLKEFYSIMPKHKSTEKLEINIKRQIKRLEEEIRERKSKKVSTLNIWNVKKEGMLQIALVGKIDESIELFRKLVGLDVNPYQVLSKPIKGVFKSMNVRLQIVLTPIEESIGEDKIDKMMNIARNADAIIVYSNTEEYVKKVIDYFNSRNIDITSNKANVEIEYTSHGGIRIAGSSKNLNEKEIVDLLHSYKIKNAIVKVTNDATLEDIEDAIFGKVSKKTIFVNNLDLYNSHNSIRYENHEQFMKDLIDKLGFIRIFTKKVNEEPEEEPLLLSKGSTVRDLARLIHKDFEQHFRYARIWRKGNLIRVGIDFGLEDMDVVEIHAKL